MKKIYLGVLSLFLGLMISMPVKSQKIENLEELKKNSKNEIFGNLGKAFRAPSMQMENYWVWGSSVVKDKAGKYHIYASRFPKSLPFHPGWMVASEIIHGTADAAQGPFTFSDVALPARGAQYWDGRSTHNPRILFYKDKYYLIYMGSTHPFEEPQYDQLTLDSKWCIVGRSNKRIGLAVSDSPYGPWKRLDEPILKTKPNTFYSFLTSNPSPMVQEDGSVVMIFKGQPKRDKMFSSMNFITTKLVAFLVRISSTQFVK